MNIEKTALNTNLEAAEEICRQIKLRDLSGLIVIDFIDMINFYNKRTVEKKMRECVRKDRARIQIGRISNFGLVEMTRQRLREGSIRWETILSLESFSQKIVKKIESLAFDNKVKIIKAYVPDKVKLFINSNLSKEISYFQKKYLFKIDIVDDSQLIIPEYKIELLNKSKKIIDKIMNVKEIKSIKPSIIKANLKSQKIDKKNQKITTKVLKEKEIIKKIKKPRTLWIRKKKAS
jgi:ribonuclease E